MRGPFGLTTSAVTVLLVSTPLSAQPSQGQGYGPYMWHDGWHGWLFGPIMMILTVAAIVVIVVLLLRWLGGSGQGGTGPSGTGYAPPGKAPLDILKERFARGEIDKEEYEERRRVLGE